MNIIWAVVIIAIWLYILRVMRKSELHFWHFLWGSCGLFVIMMLFVRPFFTQPLAQIVAAISGVFGEVSGMYTAYYKYGVILVHSQVDSMSLVIDFECSGILEIMAFLSLLLFFKAYRPWEKVLVGIVGTFYIVFANAVRITVICAMIYFWGVPAYYAAHTFVGRILFYSLSVALYFVVFTRTQIMRQKVGGFTYGVAK